MSTTSLPMSDWRWCICWLLLTAVASFLIGCGPKEQKASVLGSVTLDGKPLASGQIRFSAADGQGVTAGASITDGKFTAVLPPGEMKVEINAPKVVGKSKMYDTPDSPVVDVVKELLPPRYNAQTELTITVQPGEQQRDFALKSK
jgi:hypothetical protein